jgi:hypothetical protein
MELDEAARITQEAGREAVRQAMEARQIGSPWEISEAWLKISIAQRLLAEIKRKNEQLRILDELRLNDISNINVGNEKGIRHPIDLAVLYPWDDKKLKDRWDGRALGLIEIKKNFSLAESDAEFLSSVSTKQDFISPVKWVLLAVMINGASAEEISSGSEKIKMSGHGLCLNRKPEPKEALNLQPPSISIKDRWYGVVCYGKKIESAIMSKVEI